MTPLEAAKKFRAKMVEKYGTEFANTEDLVIWGKKKSATMGFGNGHATLVWEGGPFEWAIVESLTDFAFSMPGILAEPYNHFVLNFYEV